MHGAFAIAKGKRKVLIGEMTRQCVIKDTMGAKTVAGNENGEEQKISLEQRKNQQQVERDERRVE